jgi:uncharacterized protein (TIGR00661 family)
MKILYGVQATGNGHISRSREVIRELKDLGHDVRVLLSGRESSLLWEMDEFQPYETFQGLTFAYHRGKLKYMQTALQLNLVQFYRDIHAFDAVDYNLVITDFEPLSARIARLNRLPLIGIGHQYAFAHDIPVEGSNPLARYILNNYAPADFPVGLHWHHFKQPILPPIIPNHIEQDQKIQENKIIVYLPFEKSDDIIALLEEYKNHHFFIYHRCERAQDQNNLHLRPYSRSGFLADLAECNGVICNAGFELVSEALHLGKKILVKPLAGQMEQLSNAMVISRLKLGTAMKRLDKGKVVHFLGIPGGFAIRYPNVARLIAGWVDGGHWEDVEGLAQSAWQQTSLPAYNRTLIPGVLDL